LWNKKSKKLTRWWIEWAQDVLNYAVVQGSILERVLSSLSGVGPHFLDWAWARVLYEFLMLFFVLDADNPFIVFQHVWVVMWNNIIDLVFSGKKISSKNNIECAFF